MRASASGSNLLSKEEEQRVHGMDAYAAVGIPHEFASQVLILADALGITIALRAGEPDQLYSQSSQPKMGSVPHKSGDWGLTKAVISDDPELGRYDDGKPKNLGKERPDHLNVIQHKLSLRSLMKRLNDNCDVFGVAGDRYLLLKCKDAPTEEASGYTYRIDMKSPIDPEQINEKHINVSPKVKRKQPQWWNPIWGDFTEMQQHRFNIEYIKHTAESYKPLEIYASKDKDNNLIPITSDMDLMWISRPAEDHPLVALTAAKHDIDITEVINTYKKDGSGIIEMRQALTALCDVDDENRLKLEEIADERLGEIGCASPFEAYVILVINQRFAEFVNHIQNLLQHGADNRSPYAPSDIQRTLHFIGGEAIITENARDLRRFMLNREGYLQNYEIDLHPELDMKRWAKVVERQLSHGQKISTDLQYQYNQEKLANASPLARKASAGLESLKGSFSRLRSFTFSSPQPRRKRSSPTAQRKSSLPDELAMEQRRSSAPIIRQREPILCLEKESSEIYNEDDAFLSRANQQKVISLCRDLNKDVAWNWSMPMKGLVHGKNNGTGRDIYIQITNTSIEMQSDTVTGPAALAIHSLQKTLSPNEALNIRATEINKATYMKWLPEDERETKKL